MSLDTFFSNLQDHKPFRSKIIQTTATLVPPTEDAVITTAASLEITEMVYNDTTPIIDMYSGINATNYDWAEITINSITGSSINVLGDCTFIPNTTTVYAYVPPNSQAPNQTLTVTGTTYHNVSIPYTTITLNTAVNPTNTHIGFNIGFDWPAMPVVIPSLVLITTNSYTITG